MHDFVFDTDLIAKIQLFLLKELQAKFQVKKVVLDFFVDGTKIACRIEIILLDHHMRMEAKSYLATDAIERVLGRAVSKIIHKLSGPQRWSIEKVPDFKDKYLATMMGAILNLVGQDTSKSSVAS